MNFLKELFSLFRFWRMGGDEKQILFYAENEGYYPNFEGLIEELTNNYHSICYLTSDSKDPILQSSNQHIKSFYLRALLPFFMAFVKCKVFVMTLTDLNQFHLKRSMHSVHYVYVFHSMVSTHMMYRQGAFDHYDSILCVGPHHVEEIRKQEGISHLARKQLVEAGYYRLERIYLGYQKYSRNKVSGGRLIVLVAPSWGAKNVLESCGERLIEILLEKGYSAIVRPHPETVRRSLELMQKLAVRFSSHPNFTLEESIVTDDSLLKSDILICDCSGVALEYAFGTERPVLFLDVPYKIQNDKYKELDIKPFELRIRDQIGVIVSPEKLNTVPQIIAQLKSERPKYKKQIAKLRRDYVFGFGRSSEFGAKHILDCAN